MFFLISPRGCCCHSRSEGKDGRRRRGSPRGTAPPHRPPAFACTSCGRAWGPTPAGAWRWSLWTVSGGTPRRATTISSLKISGWTVQLPRSSEAQTAFYSCACSMPKFFADEHEEMNF